MQGIFESPPTNVDTFSHIKLIPSYPRQQVSNNNMRPILLIYERVQNPLPTSQNNNNYDPLIQVGINASLQEKDKREKEDKQIEKAYDESLRQKRQQELNEEQQKKIQQNVESLQLNVITVKGDGNCFFTSVITSLKYNTKICKFLFFAKPETTLESAKRLRTDVCLSLNKNREKYLKSGVGREFLNERLRSSTE